MTVETLKQALDEVRGGQVVVYVDIAAAVSHPFPDLDGRVAVCGYYPVEAVLCDGEHRVLTLGEPLSW